ncbi:MAG: LPS export ABC transporter periplasmic protein LptC [Alphaproteobacteria bacterium]|nr:LPS export ABC transporter periplasmic protein LptC [Alphaproteobacteria bacterium]QQS57347.1 MAG: LPS export ABC transporter periplasmic protein LptC [Alphaproteobacteria bacterium]
MTGDIDRPANFSPQSDAQRRERLSRREVSAEVYSESYTKFVRTLRLVLPLLAAGIVMVLFLWPAGDEEAIIPVKQDKEMLKGQNVAKNELTNPHFESADKKNNPYKISALRAVMGEKNENLIMMEQPVGEMRMENGAKVRVTSRTGAYRRDTERFYLNGAVDITHDRGYTLKSEETHFDLKAKLAWSDVDVTATGPDVSISAKGLRADNEKGTLLFTGPATLTLDQGLEGLE